jgi:hypothetical protein
MCMAATRPYLKHHADVHAMRAPVHKAVHHVHAALAPLRVAVPDLVQKSDLVLRCLGVVVVTLLDLQGVQATRGGLSRPAAIALSSGKEG